MPASPAQIAANRKNALHSSGPRTPEGKAISRANALKHGMTGAGIALPIEDAAEVGRRFSTLQIELAPRTEMGRILVGRVATLSVRMERCVLQESAALSEKVRHAEAEFDDRRLTEVEHLLGWIGSEPATFARRLRSTPEGIDRMAQNLRDLKEVLFDPEVDRWDWVHCERVHLIMGVRRLDVPYSRLKGLTDAMVDGDFRDLRPSELSGMGPKEVRSWARERIGEVIDAELGRLAALRESIDVGAIEGDRADAGRRALFDPSKEAILARKYEAAAERGMYRALRELGQVEARAEEAAETSPAGPGPLDSFSPDDEGPEPPRPSPPARPYSPAAPTPLAPHFDRVGEADDGPRLNGAIGRGVA